VLARTPEYTGRPSGTTAAGRLRQYGSRRLTQPTPWHPPLESRRISPTVVAAVKAEPHAPAELTLAPFSIP